MFAGFYLIASSLKLVIQGTKNNDVRGAIPIKLRIVRNVIAVDRRSHKQRGIIKLLLSLVRTDSRYGASRFGIVQQYKPVKATPWKKDKEHQ